MVLTGKIWPEGRAIKKPAVSRLFCSLQQLTSWPHPWKLPQVPEPVQQGPWHRQPEQQVRQELLHPLVQQVQVQVRAQERQQVREQGRAWALPCRKRQVPARPRPRRRWCVSLLVFLESVEY